jgi:membrane protease YdiL (CAAX protease family)
MTSRRSGQDDPDDPSDRRASPTYVSRRFSVTGFVVLTFAITWVVWIPRALAANGSGPDWVVTFGSVWSHGPAIAAVVASLLWGGRPALRDLGARLIRWRVGAQWYLLVLAGPAAVWLLTAALHTALGGEASDAAPLAVEAGLVGAVPLLLALCLTDGLGEETGWRGYALPRLLERTRPVTASLLLGMIWALWHLPLYWTPGVPLYQSPILLLFVDLPITSLLYTWVFRHTGGSALLAVLLHGAGNLFAVPLHSAGEGPLQPFLLAVLVRAALAVAAVVAFRRGGERTGAVTADAKSG